jgi:hypothetical protein
MHGRQQAYVYPQLREFGRLPFERGDGEQEGNKVDGDEPDRDNRPSPRLHVLVTDGYQHALCCSTGNLTLNSALQARAPQSSKGVDPTDGDQIVNRCEKTDRMRSNAVLNRIAPRPA